MDENDKKGSEVSDRLKKIPKADRPEFQAKETEAKQALRNMGVPGFGDDRIDKIESMAEMQAAVKFLTETLRGKSQAEAAQGLTAFFENGLAKIDQNDWGKFIEARGKAVGLLKELGGAEHLHELDEMGMEEMQEFAAACDRLKASPLVDDREETLKYWFNKGFFPTPEARTEQFKKNKKMDAFGNALFILEKARKALGREPVALSWPKIEAEIRKHFQEQIRSWHEPKGVFTKAEADKWVQKAEKEYLMDFKGEHRDGGFLGDPKKGLKGNVELLEGRMQKLQEKRQKERTEFTDKKVAEAFGKPPNGRLLSVERMTRVDEKEPANDGYLHWLSTCSYEQFKNHEEKDFPNWVKHLEGERKKLEEGYMETVAKNASFGPEEIRKTAEWLKTAPIDDVLEWRDKKLPKLIAECGERDAAFETELSKSALSEEEKKALKTGYFAADNRDRVKLLAQAREKMLKCDEQTKKLSEILKSDDTFLSAPRKAAIGAAIAEGTTERKTELVEASQKKAAESRELHATMQNEMRQLEGYIATGNVAAGRKLAGMLLEKLGKEVNDRGITAFAALMPDARKFAEHFGIKTTTAGKIESMPPIAVSSVESVMGAMETEAAKNPEAGVAMRKLAILAMVEEDEKLAGLSHEIGLSEEEKLRRRTEAANEKRGAEGGNAALEKGATEAQKLKKAVEGTGSAEAKANAQNAPSNVVNIGFGDKKEILDVEAQKRRAEALAKGELSANLVDDDGQALKGSEKRFEKMGKILTGAFGKMLGRDVDAKTAEATVKALREQRQQMKGKSNAELTKMTAEQLAKQTAANNDRYEKAA